MVVCLEQGADLHMAQLMPLTLTVTCFSKIQIGFTFLVVAHLGSPGKRAVKRVCVCACFGAVGKRAVKRVCNFVKTFIKHLQHLVILFYSYACSVKSHFLQLYRLSFLALLCPQD